MIQKGLVPKRRLMGYTNEWSARKFDEEIELYSGLTYSPNDVNKKGTLVLRSSNVKFGEIVAADNVYVNSEVVNSANVKTGDVIVVVRNGSRSLIGKHALIKRRMDNTVIGAFMTGIRSDQPNFINALLDTKRFKKEIEKNLGATINQITNGMFREMTFLFPEVEEQQQIGNFFKHLDQMIALEQRKLEKTKALKSAYLAEMFPAEGERVPKRRFAGFMGEWDRVRLDTISTSYSGGTPTANNKLYYGGEIPFIRSGEINSKKTNLFITKEGLNTSSAKLVNKGDILYALYGATSGEVGISKIDGAINQAILAIKLEGQINSYFIAQWLRKQKDSIIQKYLQGGQGNLSGNIIKQLLIDLPRNSKEQQAIGEFFKKLDDSITNQQQKLSKLKAMKQAYLQEMFV